jgi:hypothetical protein
MCTLLVNETVENEIQERISAWVLRCMTAISFDINVGRAVLERHFDLSLGRLHEIHLNIAQESSSYLTGHISPLQRPISWCCLMK